MTAAVLDSHRHIFVDGLRYPWLGARDVPLGAAQHGDWSAILVEAGAADPVAEARATQRLAEQHAWIRGFIAPLALEGAERFDCIVGYRATLDQPITPVASPLDLLLGETDWQAALQVLAEATGSVVLDHCGGGAVGSVAWRAFIGEAARHPHAYIKVSAAPPRAAVEQVLAVFGAERVLFGSDWPVTGGPDDQVTTLLAVLGASAAESDAVLAATAERVYGVRRG